jgi:hypothetical protein
MHCLGVPAKRGLVDKPLRAIEPPSTDLRGEMPLELTLDRSNQVRHYATSCSSSGFGDRFVGSAGSAVDSDRAPSHRGLLIGVKT